MATIYKIHPAIGIARIGNSPEFFIGPERVGEQPNPPGGFKDAQCRVKRQAARFRIFAHHDDNTVEEITEAEAEITWTVHLANRKAAYLGRGNTNEPAKDLIIDPGARTTTGPNQQKLFDNGVIRFTGQPAVTVPLGEMRTDDENHLLVLGGSGKSASPDRNAIVDFWGNPGWYDDISDGPISATIKIRATNETPVVVSAWVICAPPKFAPHQENATTLYDRVFQAMVDAGLAVAPTTTSYTRDIYPILQRARDIKWVYETYAHNWPDPVTDPAVRAAIFSRLKPPGNMPQLLGGDSALTAIQYAHMQRWKDNLNFANDWTGIPAPEATISPAGLDRAALEACVGGAFFPGIEAGGKSPGNRPILESAYYTEAFRIKPATEPGRISASMALPWQADFYACGNNWWPVPRPNEVLPQGATAYVNWARDIGDYEAMVSNWHSLGFVVQQGNQHVEVERCDTATITLLTPQLNFTDIPQGSLGMVREQPLAISFEVISPGIAITLEFAPGGAPTHPQLVAANPTVTVGPTAGNSVATARLWIVYRTGAAPSAIPTQTVTVHEPVSGQTWSILINANTIAHQTAAVALVLDRSGSMSNDRGDGQSKHVSLQQAAETFVNVMLDGDGVGLVRYDQDAQVVQPVVQLGAGGISDLNRNGTIDLIRGNSFDPAGATSIGDGIYEGRQILNAVAGSYQVKALVVLTDGVENRPRYISDVAAEINERTYAIGLGTPQNTSAAALQTISGNHGGFLLVTGAIGTDNRFLLQKYFLQILAGVSNAEVVLDPDGELTPGAVQRIPFQLTEADTGVDVILLSPQVQAVDFRLQTPTGLILEPWRARSEPAMRYSLGNGVSYYRLVLPTQLIADRFDQGGTWHVLLTIGRPRLEPSGDHPQGIDSRIIHGLHSNQEARVRARQEQGVFTERQRSFAIAQTHLAAATGERFSLPYSLIVHSYSNVAFRAELHQSGYEPGARISVQATLTQSGLPVEGEGVVWGELTRPNGIQATLAFNLDEPGGFSAEFMAASAGVYKLRVRARGRTRKGMPFTREQTLTAQVWSGGDRDAEAAAGGGTRILDLLNQRDERLCELFKCLFQRGVALSPELEERLRAEGMDVRLIHKCLEKYCAHDRRRRGSQDG